MFGSVYIPIITTPGMTEETRCVIAADYGVRLRLDDNNDRRLGYIDSVESYKLKTPFPELLDDARQCLYHRADVG